LLLPGERLLLAALSLNLLRLLDTLLVLSRLLILLRVLLLRLLLLLDTLLVLPRLLILLRVLLLCFLLLLDTLVLLLLLLGTSLLLPPLLPVGFALLFATLFALLLQRNDGNHCTQEQEDADAGGGDYWNGFHKSLFLA
jgi:hypothetical protein